MAFIFVYSRIFLYDFLIRKEQKDALKTYIHMLCPVVRLNRYTKSEIRIKQEKQSYIFISFPFYTTGNQGEVFFSHFQMLSCSSEHKEYFSPLCLPNSSCIFVPYSLNQLPNIHCMLKNKRLLYISMVHTNSSKNILLLYAMLSTKAIWILKYTWCFP